MRVSIILAVVVAMATSAAGTNLVLVEFETDSYEATLAKLREIEERGVTVRHVFAPNHAIVDMHGLPQDFVEMVDYVSVFSRQDLLANPAALDRHPAREAFLHITDEAARNLPIPDGAVMTEPPAEEWDSSDPRNSTERTSIAYRLTGQYMIGYIAVGIYLMESTGPQENWWPAAEQQTFNEIVEGLD